VAEHKYGNGIRNTANPAALGNGEMGHLRKRYSITKVNGNCNMGQLRKGYSLKSRSVGIVKWDSSERDTA